MTTKEALEILRTASGLAPLNRQDHTKILEAISVIEKVLAEKKD
jgi:hypothetical protein